MTVFEFDARSGDVENATAIFIYGNKRPRWRYWLARLLRRPTEEAILIGYSPDKPVLDGETLTIRWDKSGRFEVEK